MDKVVYQKNPPDCIILDNWVFDNLISVDKLFAKALRRFATCLLFNNSLWGKFVSSSPTTFNNSLKAASVLFFIADFNLLSCEFDICKLGPTKWFKFGSCSNNSGFARFLFQWILLLKLDFNCGNNFALSWVDKVTTGT